MATKKINLKKENVETVNANETVNVEKENVQMENAKTVETVETVEAKKEIEKMENVKTVEAIRKEIVEKINFEKVRLGVWNDVDYKGQHINATNWSKDDTRTGKDTLGGYVRDNIKICENRIEHLKNCLKETYFDLLPELKALQSSDNDILKSVANDCIKNMRNVPVIKNQFAVTPDIVKLLAQAGIKNIGVTPDILGVVLPVLITNGYVYDMTSVQPVTVDEIKIEGLDKIPSCTYYNFKLAE